MKPPETLIGRLERAAETSEGVRFLDRGGERFVLYRTVLERAASVAGGLEGLSVRPGDRIAVAVPTSPEFYDAFFGVLAAGAVPVSLPPPPRFGSRHAYREALGELLRASGARTVLSVARLRTLFEGHETVSLEELPRSKPRITAPAPDALALVQLSSGTTGAPKPVGLSHRQLLGNVDALLDLFLGAYPPENGYEHGGVSWLPLYHDMGLVGSVLTALARPGPLALMKPEEFVARPARWLQAISRYRATVSAAPHFAYELVLERVRDEEMKGVDLSCWLFALDGAETVTPSTLERFYERFRHYGLRREALTPVYGLAEASLAVTFSDPRASFRSRRFDGRALVERGRAVESGDGAALVSCGRPLPGVQVRIAADEGGPLTEGFVGRVMVKGPSISRDGTGRDGWLDTGDRGFLFEGELYLCGRTKDVVVLQGRNYAAEVLERGVAAVSGVRAGGVAAFAIPGEKGERLCLLAERDRELDEEGESRLIGEIRARLVEEWGVAPHSVQILEPGSIPRTSSGKLRRREAARRFAGDFDGA